MIEGGVMAGLTKCATTCNLSFSPCGALHVLVVVGAEVPGGGGGGGHSGTEWLPTAKRPSGVEGVNAKI